MGLEQILRRINEDAKAEVGKIIDESEKKATEIDANAKKEVEELARALLKEAEREANLEASRLITQARLEGKINLLSRKKGLIGEVLEKAFQSEKFDRMGLKKEVVLKDGRREESFGEEKLKEELRPRLESYIVRILKL